MAFERDIQTGSLIRGSLVSYALLSVVALLLGCKTLLDASKNRIMGIILLLCAAYMLGFMIHFLRLYGLWRKASFALAEDQVKGFGGKGKFGWGRTLVIPAREVEKMELVTVPLTKRTPLTALRLTAASGEYYFLGLDIDEHQKRVFGLREADS